MTLEDNPVSKYSLSSPPSVNFTTELLKQPLLESVPQSFETFKNSVNLEPNLFCYNSKTMYRNRPVVMGIYSSQGG